MHRSTFTNYYSRNCRPQVEHLLRFRAQENPSESRKTIGEGETASIKLAGQSVSVRCLAINEQSATVSVGGASGTQGLYLNE
jgi:hypothetical protein